MSDQHRTNIGGFHCVFGHIWSEFSANLATFTEETLKENFIFCAVQTFGYAKRI